MAWKIINGRPTKTEVSVGLSPPEVAPTVEGLFECPYCDKTYKTETGFDNHVADKH